MVRDSPSFQQLVDGQPKPMNWNRPKVFEQRDFVVLIRALGSASAASTGYAERTNKDVKQGKTLTNGHLHTVVQQVRGQPHRIIRERSPAAADSHAPAGPCPARRVPGLA